MVGSVVARVAVLALGVAAHEDFAPWYGAAPPKVLSDAGDFVRSGWERCTMCGGSERLGASVDIGDVHNLDAAGTERLIDAVRAYGVVVVRGQNLTRRAQVEFTEKLGPVVVLPTSFEGKDPEPGEPAIQRITNFWSNGTWKGPTAKFGAYWHQDGQFWQEPMHNILSVLHAQQTPPAGGETGFADLRAARTTLSKPLEELASKLHGIEASVREIKDFAGGLESDLAKFPNATHLLLVDHALDGGPMLYLGSPSMRVTGLPGAKRLLDMLFEHATSPAFTYYHMWQPGDILIWDNTQTLHHAFPYNNDGTHHREFYRTQARFAGEKNRIVLADDAKHEL